MADDFIPLNQSTPVHGKWQNRNQNQGYQNSRYHQNGQRRGGSNQNRWGNNSQRNSSVGSSYNAQRNSSFGSDSNNSFGHNNKNSINAYLHPSMLQDPWAQLKQENN